MRQKPNLIEQITHRRHTLLSSEILSNHSATPRSFFFLLSVSTFPINRFHAMCFLFFRPLVVGPTSSTMFSVSRLVATQTTHCEDMKVLPFDRFRSSPPVPMTDTWL